MPVSTEETKMPEITYGELYAIIRSFGFISYEPQPGTRVYKHANSGALLVLPIFPDKDRVYGHHLTATGMTLDGYGIASKQEFASRLWKASGSTSRDEVDMPEITYGRLSEILRSLGFTIREPKPGVRVFEHAESGAAIVLPAFPDNDRVYGHHLADAKMTLDAFGIVNKQEFASRLSKAS